MKFNQIIHYFQKNEQCTFHLHNKNTEIFAFHTYVPVHQQETNVIYICLIDEIEKKGSTKPLNYLCITKSENDILADEIKKAYPNSNFLLCTTNESEKHIYDLIGSLFLAEIRYTQQITRLLDISNSNKGLQALVDEAYQITHSPIIIIDTSYRILAMYRESQGEEYFGLKKQRDIGYLTEQTLSRMKRDNFYEKLRHVNTFMYSKAPDAKYYWYDSLIHVHGIEVGEIGIMEYDHKFDDYDFQLFKFLKQLVVREMEKNNFFIPHKGLMHSIFLSELLEQKFVSNDAIQSRMNMLGWKETKGYFILIAYSNDQENFQQKANFFALQVQTIIPDVHWIINSSDMIFLIGTDNDSLEPFSPDTSLSNLFEYNQMLGILSNYFANIKEIPKYYTNTLAIKEFNYLGNNHSPISIYSDYSIFHIAKIISETHEIKDFYHPVVVKIKEYDQENNTAYIETLHQYLLYTDNPTICAKILCVHKNTFFYRMSRIKELFPINLNQGRERLRILLTLELMRLQK